MPVQYGLHGTVVSVHLLYSTIRTMLTVVASLPYRMHVLAASYGSFRAPAVQYRSYHAGTMIRRCPGCIHHGVTFVRFEKSTLIATSFLKLPCLPSFLSQLLALPLSHSLSFLVSLSIVVLPFLLIVVLSFVIAP
jgi:hypothetical protein